MKSINWIKVFGILGVLFVATIVAGIAVLKSINFNDFKPDIKAMIEDATGRDVALNGDLRLSISLNPALELSDVTLGNAVWGNGEPMVVLKSLKAQVDLVSLFSGRIDVDYFLVDGLKLVFQTNGKGLANWEFESKTVSQAPQSDNTHGATEPLGAMVIVPRVRDVRLRNVDLTYMDGATGGKFHVLLNAVNVQADTFDSPMQVDIAAAFQGVDFDVRANLGSMHLFVGKQGGAFPVDLTAKAPGLLFTVKGSVEQPGAGMTVKARVDAQLKDMIVASKLSGVDLSAVQNVRLSMNISGAGTKYVFSDIVVRSNDSDIKGKAQIDLSNSRPDVQGALTANLINIDGFVGSGQANKSQAVKSQSQKDKTDAPASSEGSLFTNDPLAFALLNSANVDLSFKAKKVIVQAVDVTKIQTRIKLKDGRLQVTPLSLEIFDGVIKGKVSVDGGKKRPVLSSHIKLTGVDAGQVIQTLGLGDLASLKINGDLKVSANGRSSREIVSNLNGTIKLYGRNGKINDQTIKSLGSGLSNILPWASQKDSSLISCFVARFPLKNGNVVAETVQLDTPGFTVQLTGNIDLPGERLHLTVNPKAKTTSLTSFAVPIRIKGSLMVPYVTVNPEDLVLGTVGNIVKAPVGVLLDIFGAGGGSNADKSNDPCLQSFAGKTKASKSKTKTPPPQQNQTTQGTNPLDKLGKGLGNALQGLFGQ